VCLAEHWNFFAADRIKNILRLRAMPHLKHKSDRQKSEARRPGTHPAYGGLITNEARS
jgi:hypothetical protein